MPWNDPMGDSSDPESSNYGGGYSNGPSDNGGDSWSRAYTGMGNAAAKWSASRPGIDIRMGDFAGPPGLAKGVARNVANQVKWDKSVPYGAKANRGASAGNPSRGGDDQGWRGRVYGTGTGVGSTPAAGAGAGTSCGMFPSVYTDPVTGRLLYQSQGVGNTSNQSYSDQLLLDQLMGTSVAGQNIDQQIKQTEDYLDNLEASYTL